MFFFTSATSEVIKTTLGHKMTIAKSNRCNEYMKEIEHIKYEYLQKNEFFCTPLQRKFYEHRVQLLETYIQNYINTTDEQKYT